MGELWSASTVIFRLPFQALCCFKRTVYGAVRYTPRASYPFRPATPSPIDHLSFQTRSRGLIGSDTYAWKTHSPPSMVPVGLT